MEIGFVFEKYERYKRFSVFFHRFDDFNYFTVYDVSWSKSHYLIATAGGDDTIRLSIILMKI